MAHESEHKSAAELQREIELQRSRVENTIDEIQQKLSPGQLVDELLAYTKGGGGEFVSSLQRNVTANPLPVALLGVSLAWLMAKPAGASDGSATDRSWDSSINTSRGLRTDHGATPDYESHYPITKISGGSLQRLGRIKDESGNTYSEFSDDAGKKFRALSDETGRRAGHFVDEAGSSFRGFTSAAGEKVDQFRDEAGNLLDEASGWASHVWGKANEKLHDARDALNSDGGTIGSHAGNAADALRHQSDKLNHTIMTQFKDQPLVAGALAFALGAALASTLPHTQQEDKLMGEAADALKDKATVQAADLYEQGKENAADLYDKAAKKVGDAYDKAKTGVSDAVQSASPQS